MKTFTLVMLAVLLSLVAVVPLHAQGRDCYATDVDLYFPLLDCTTDDGQDFQVWDHVTAQETVHLSYDANGTWSGAVWELDGADHLYHPDDPGYLVEGAFSQSCDLRVTVVEQGYQIAIERCNGMTWDIQLPGAGLVSHAAGPRLRGDDADTPDQWVDDTATLIELVKRASLDPYDAEALCRHFAR